MTRWFRVYDSLVDDPKVQRLPDPLFRAVINLWCLASRNGGRLPAAGDIAFALRMTPDRVDRLIGELRRLELIDAVDGGLAPHNWEGRQFASDRSNDRVGKWREQRRNDAGNGQRNVTSGVTVTADATPPDSESESESKISHSGLGADEDRVRVKFGDFCRKYPDRDRPLNPDTTWRAWCRAHRAGADLDEIVDNTARFADAERRAGRVGTRYVPTAERFLDEGRWKGYPAPAARPGAAASTPAVLDAAPPDPRWTAVCERLAGTLGADVTNAWFRGMRLVSIDGAVARVRAPTKFGRGYVETNYARELLAAARGALGDEIARVVVLEPSQARPSQVDDGAAPGSPAVERSSATAAMRELARQTVMTEGAAKVARWLGRPLFDAVQVVQEHLATLGGDAIALMEILAAADKRKLAGVAALGWTGQEVARIAAPMIAGLHPPQEVTQAAAATPAGKRKRVRR